MNENVLQEKIKLLQEKYTMMLTQAAQEGRMADVQSLSNQMQQEIQSLINAETQSALNSNMYTSPAGNDESQEDGGFIEEDQEDEDEEAEDEDWDEEEAQDDDDIEG